MRAVRVATISESFGLVYAIYAEGRLTADIVELARSSDAVTADRVSARIYAVAKLLTDYPHMGHDGAAPGTFEMVVARLPVVIIYRIDFKDFMPSHL